MIASTGLGIEIENARIKCVLASSAGIRSREYALSFASGGDREEQLEAGLLEALARFEREVELPLAGVPTAVAASCHFAFPTFGQAHGAVLHVLERHLPRAFLAAADGLYSLDRVQATGSHLRFVLGRTAGIRAVAEAFSGAQLAIDCGSTSTEAVRLTGSRATGHQTDPDRDSRDRLQDGRLTWLGAFDTPVDYVAERAGGYRLVPRMARMRSIWAIAPSASGTARAMRGLPSSGPGSAPEARGLAALAIKLVDADAARRELAQAVGLDAELLGDAILGIADEVRSAAVAMLCESWRRVIGAGEPPREAAVMGWGAHLLAEPALRALGVKRIVDVEDAAGVPPNFAAALGLAIASIIPENSPGAGLRGAGRTDTRR